MPVNHECRLIFVIYLLFYSFFSDTNWSIEHEIKARQNMRKEKIKAHIHTQKDYISQNAVLSNA